MHGFFVQRTRVDTVQRGIMACPKSKSERLAFPMPGLVLCQCSGMPAPGWGRQMCCSSQSVSLQGAVPSDGSTQEE